MKTPGCTGPRWAAAAAQGLTLVIYMSVADRRRGSVGLLHSLPATTPVAVVQHASLPQQRHAVGTLAGLVSLIAHHRLGSPAIILVGDVLSGLRQVEGVAGDIDRGRTRGLRLDFARWRAQCGTLAGERGSVRAMRTGRRR